ncbi:MAG: DUF2807 domain-containing protein [Bacteroidota bacterium]
MMNNLKITFLTAILLFSFLNINLAQINGNGQMKTLKLDASTVTTLHANFPIQLILDNSQNAQIEITTDENVLAALKINSGNKKISILQDAWVEPSRMVQVKGSLPALTQLKMEGYGNANIQNLEAQSFKLQVPVGTAKIAGKVNQISIDTRGGNIDALQLLNDNATIDIKGYGTVMISPRSTLKMNLSEDATLVYETKPPQINPSGTGRWITMEAYQQEVLPEVEYIKIKLKNNKTSKIDTYVRGPKQERFGYGIPFKARQSRTESWPVGTKLYLVNGVGMRKLLYTVSKEDANQTVDLFSR